MYRLPHIYDNTEQTPMPTCMYNLPNLTIKDDINNATTAEDNDNLNKLKELEQKQKKILEQLHQLKESVDNIHSKKVVASSVEHCRNDTGNINQLRIPIHDVVIYASPDCPPLSLLIVKQLLAKETTVMVSKYTHSSILKPPSPLIQNFMTNDEQQAKKQLTRLENKLAISLIWKDVGADPVLIVNPLAQCPIVGELNIVRYLFRLLKDKNYYNEWDAVQATKIDSLLESIHLLMFHGNPKQQNSLLHQLHEILAKQPFVVGQQWTIADLLLWSSLVFFKRPESIPTNVKTWLTNCNNMEIFKNAMKSVYVR